MATYLIFDAATGRPVQTHVEPDELDRSREEILAEAVAAEHRQGLELRVVDPDQVASGCHVDVATGQLVTEPAEQDPDEEVPAGGAGGASLQATGGLADVETRYVPRGRAVDDAAVETAE